MLNLANRRSSWLQYHLVKVQGTTVAQQRMPSRPLDTVKQSANSYFDNTLLDDIAINLDKDSNHHTNDLRIKILYRIIRILPYPNHGTFY